MRLNSAIPARIILAAFLLLLAALLAPTNALQAQSEDDPRALGDPNAPIVIIEYSDYECPACASFVLNTKPQLLQQYVESGKVRYIYRDNPLPQHPSGLVASAFAHCAAQQGQFWPMHDRLFAGYIASEWGGDPARAERTFSGYASELGLDSAALRACVRDPATEAAIIADIDEARERGLRGTPGYVLRWPGGPERGDILTGAQSFGTWSYLLDERLTTLAGTTPQTTAATTEPSLITYLALAAAGGILVLLAGGSVLWWLHARKN